MVGMILRLMGRAADAYDHVVDRPVTSRYAIDACEAPDRARAGGPSFSDLPGRVWLDRSLGTRRMTTGGARTRRARRVVLCSQGPVISWYEPRRLVAATIPIPDLPVVGLPRRWRRIEVGSRRRGSARRWSHLGVPDFGPVQTNLSFNGRRGTTRGIHGEPWGKSVTVATGRVFGAWVDLREGPRSGPFHRSSSIHRWRCSCRGGSVTPFRRSRTEHGIHLPRE